MEVRTPEPPPFPFAWLVRAPIIPLLLFAALRIARQHASYALPLIWGPVPNLIYGIVSFLLFVALASQLIAIPLALRALFRARQRTTMRQLVAIVCGLLQLWLLAIWAGLVRESAYT